MPQTRLGRIVRVAAFGVASVIGFMVAEAIIVVGLYVVFGELNVPRGTYSAPGLIVLDALALVTGVVVSFLLNERSAVGTLRSGQERPGLLVRLAKFQLVSALGNVVVIAVQLLLLSAFGITPAIGNIVGGVLAFPVTYIISIRMVWI